MMQEGGDAEIRQSGTEEYGGQLAVFDSLQVKCIARTVQKLHFFTKDIQVCIGDDAFQGIAEYAVGTQVYYAVFLFIKVYLVFQSVIDAFKGQAVADGPGNRRGGQAQRIFQVGHTIQRVFGLTVQFVDEGEDGDLSHGANLEQFYCLGFHTFRRIDDHDRTVHGGQDTVSIFTKVVMTGGIHDGNHFVIIFKLHNGGSNGDTSLFFNFHPVGFCEFVFASCLYRTCFTDGAAVQQQFFCQRCFTCVGVRNDTENATLLDFLRIAHRSVPFCSFLYQSE